MKTITNIILFLLLIATPMQAFAIGNDVAGYTNSNTSSARAARGGDSSSRLGYDHGDSSKYVTKRGSDENNIYGTTNQGDSSQRLGKDRPDSSGRLGVDPGDSSQYVTRRASDEAGPAGSPLGNDSGGVSGGVQNPYTLPYGSGNPYTIPYGGSAGQASIPVPNTVTHQPKLLASTPDVLSNNMDDDGE